MDCTFHSLYLKYIDAFGRRCRGATQHKSEDDLGRILQEITDALHRLSKMTDLSAQTEFTFGLNAINKIYWAISKTNISTDISLNLMRRLIQDLPDLTEKFDAAGANQLIELLITYEPTEVIVAYLDFLPAKSGTRRSLSSVLYHTILRRIYNETNEEATRALRGPQTPILGYAGALQIMSKLNTYGFSPGIDILATVLRSDRRYVNHRQIPELFHLLLKQVPSELFLKNQSEWDCVIMNAIYFCCRYQSDLSFYRNLLRLVPKPSGQCVSLILCPDSGRHMLPLILSFGNANTDQLRVDFFADVISIALEDNPVAYADFLRCHLILRRIYDFLAETGISADMQIYRSLYNCQSQMFVGWFDDYSVRQYGVRTYGLTFDTLSRTLVRNISQYLSYTDSSHLSKIAFLLEICSEIVEKLNTRCSQ